MTQVIFVNRGANECFHRLKLPTEEERFGINWRVVLYEVRCSAPTLCFGDRAGRFLGCKGEMQDPNVIAGK